MPYLFKHVRKKCRKVKRETVKLDCYVNVESNIDELEQKAKRLNEILREAKTLADELASQNLEINLKI